MPSIIEIGMGGVFELPPPTNRNIDYYSDPLFWANVPPFEDAEKTYRHLLELNFPLLFHIYAKNQETANAQALAVKKILGDMASKARFEGGVGEQKLPFNALCCVDDDISYLVKSNAEIKAIVDRSYNSEMANLNYRNVIRQMYRLEKPTQMNQLAMFMRNRKELFI